MSAFWTEDPSIGNALAGLATSFDTSKIEDRKKKIAERLAKERYGQASADFAETQRTRDLGISLPPEWGGSINLDVPTYQWTNPNDYAERQKVLANATVDLGAQTTMKNAQEAAAVQALNQLQSQGVPQTAAGQTIMQTQLTGQLPMLDAKGTTNNYGVVDSDGNLVAKGTTRDGRTDLVTGQPIVPPAGHSVVKMGELPADQSPYKDNGAQLRALQALNEKAARGERLSETEQQRANILFNSQFPLTQKLEKDDAGNMRPVMIREKQPPSSFGPLLGQLGMGAPVGPPATAPAPPPAPVAPATTGGPAVTAAPPTPTAAPPAAAPAAPPIVPPPQGPAGVTVGAPAIQGSGDTQLKEVLNHPTVKGAIEATRAYDEMTRARQANTPEAALHMIYMLAKIYDPNSVVREGEVATASNTSPAFEKIWGIYNKQRDAQSPLSERAKESFLNEGYKAASAHYDAAKGLVDFAGERATRLGLDPRNVMPPLNAPTPPAKQETPARTGATAPAPTRPVEVTPADREALAWANKNPNDPRAAAIKKKLGMQ